MSVRDVTLILNGRSVTKPVEARRHLADFLREDHLLTGTHLGCEQGVCGACTVFVDGRPVRSCITLSVACDSADVRTVEGFDDDQLMGRIREAFQKHHGLQCGYCTPGVLATAYDIARRLPNASREQIKMELSGNLCRCTGYTGIINAIEDVLAHDPPPASLHPMAKHRVRSVNEANAPASSVSTPASPGQAEATHILPSRSSLQNAKTISRSIELAVPQITAWEVLSDPAKVVACVPGARLSEHTQDGAITGSCGVSVGPIKAVFEGKGEVTYASQEMRGSLIGAGADPASRTSLAGAMDFTISEIDAGQCRLSLDARYRLSGPLAQFARPSLIEEIAGHILSETGANLERLSRGEEPANDTLTSLNGLKIIAQSTKMLFLRLVRLR